MAILYYDSVHQNMNNAASLSKLKFVNIPLVLVLKIQVKTDSNNEKSTQLQESNTFLLRFLKKLLSFSFGIKPQTSLGYFTGK